MIAEPLSATYVGLLACILVTGVVGWRAANVPAVVNAAAAFLVASSPPLLEAVVAAGTGATVSFGPELRLWIAAAGFLHQLGMLGWYDTVWWWDHLTHTVSAAFLASLAYTNLWVVDRQLPEVSLSLAYVVAFTVLFTLAVGVLWELIELAARVVGDAIDRPPVLEHYGLRDTALDMVFNAVGATLVVAFDLRTSLFVDYPRVAALTLGGSVVAVAVGVVVLSVALDPDAGVKRGLGENETGQ